MICAQGTVIVVVVTEKVENKLQKQEGIQANSPSQGCTCSKKQYGLSYKGWKQEKKTLAASVRDGNVPPAAKENSGIEWPGPGLETGEALILLDIRQATGFLLFISLWISSVSML